MSNNKKAKPEENILVTSATSTDLAGINLPVKEETPEEREEREKQEAFKKINEALDLAEKVTKKQDAIKRMKDAKKDAKEAHVKQYEGNAKAFLLARRFLENDNQLSFYDYQFSYIDENGYNVPLYGKASITSVMTANAGKAFRDSAKAILDKVVAFKRAENDEERAKIRTSVHEAFKTIFTYLGVDCGEGWEKRRKPDMNAILTHAYEIDVRGDDDTKGEGKVVLAACYIAKRILAGREAAANAYEAKQAKAAKKAAQSKTEKTAA